MNQQTIIAIIAIVTAFLAFYVAFRWRGSYIPVNFLFFIAIGIFLLMLSHYYFDLVWHPEEAPHRQLFGFRASRVINVCIEALMLIISLSALTFKKRYTLSIEEFKDKYKIEVEGEEPGSKDKS